jgi:accessory colonization factor AcfC
MAVATVMRERPSEEKRLTIFATHFPAIPTNEAARTYEKRSGVKFDAQTGPVELWLPRVRAGEGDIISVGSEYIMDDIRSEDLVIEETRATVGYRRSIIIVRKGNPMGIRSLQDLTEEGVRLLVCIGGCQKGLWDDVASKAMLTDKVRKNIVQCGMGCADTLRRWRATKDTIDAGIVWNVYKDIAPEDCDAIELPESIRVMRSTNVAITSSSRNRELAQSFIDFLRGDEGRQFFVKWGWMVG